MRKSIRSTGDIESCRAGSELSVSGNLMMRLYQSLLTFAVVLQCSSLLWGEAKFPPELSGGQSRITLKGKELLKRAGSIKPDVEIATAAPTVDVMYYPGQNYPGHPWSVWGDGLMVGNIYYSSIGDHLAPAGNAYVYAYDTETGELKQIVDIRRTINMPEGHYTPGKIHSRLDLGKDGCLYFSTHRGSTRITTDEYHYKGDWILKHDLASGKTEVVVHAPLAKQCLPTGQLDPERLIFYAGTADGDYKVKRVKFLAYDTVGKKMLYSDDQGPYRAMIFAPSTGRVYYQQEGKRGEAASLVRFDPEGQKKPVAIQASLGLRAASEESDEGIVYTIDGDELWAFDTQNETAQSLGPAAVGTQTYTASLDLDPATNRYLYYVPGAHGGSQQDGAPLVQYDVKTRKRKVICFLEPLCHRETGFLPMGTYGMAVSPDGSKVCITWNGNTGSTPAELQKGKPKFNACGLTVVHIPASERQP